MREPLTLTRFQELADAYGGVVARWPARYRDAAMAMASTAAARDILDTAAALDEVLDTWRVPLPSRSYREQVVVGAPAPVGRIAARARLWWSGVGIAAALAGATAGTAVVAMAAPVDTASDSSTSFGDVTGSET